MAIYVVLQLSRIPAAISTCRSANGTDLRTYNTLRFALVMDSEEVSLIFWKLVFVDTYVVLALGSWDSKLA